MAVVEPYAPCPCGSGEKFKWCCQKVEAYAERAQKLLDNSQIEAALGVLDEGLRKEADNPWLALRKAMILARRDQLAPAVELVRRVVAKRPQHLGAHAFLVQLVVRTEGPQVAAGQLQHALTTLPEDQRPGLALAAELLGAMMVEAGHVAAGIAHLELAEALSQDDPDSQAASSLRMIEANAQVSPWLRNPYELSPVPEALNDDRRGRFLQAIEWADQGLWSSAAAAFDSLAAAGTPECDRNLGLCRLWLADEAGAVEALRRHTGWVGPSTDSVDLEALCQVVAPVRDADKVELLQWIWPVRNHDLLLNALRADSQVHEDGKGPMDPSDPESFEVDQFLLLDKPRTAAGASTPRPDDLPRIDGRVLVGREIVALEAYDDGRLDGLAQRFRDLAGDAITPAHPRTKLLGHSTRASLALRTEWLLPEGLAPAESERLTSLERERVVFQVWPDTPMPYLNGRTPRQAAAAGDAQTPLRAALCQLELGQEFFRDGVDFAALRSELNIPAEPEIDPDSAEIDQIHLARLHRVPAARLDDDRLVALFSRAHRTLMPLALEQSAMALVARPALLEAEDGLPRFTVFADLANLALSRGDEAGALEWVRKGRASDPASQKAGNAPRWDMLQIRLLSRTQPPETWVPELAAVLERYPEGGETSSILISNLVDMGLMRLAPNPDRPGAMLLDSRPLQAVMSRYGPRITTASGQLGVSATKGGIWTPGSEAAGGSTTGGGIWTPGQTLPTKGGDDKPKLIIPGR